MKHLIGSTYWTQLNSLEPFSGIASRLQEKQSITPTNVCLEGNRQLVLEYEYRGKGTTICLQATWDFRWQKFYFVKLTQSPLHFSTTDFVDSPFMTESEFLSEVEAFENNPDFVKLDEKVQLQEDDLDYILSRFKS